MKRSLLFMLMALLMSVSGWAQVECRVCDSTTSDYYVPLYGNYNYSISQSLYTSEELINVPTGTITSLSYRNTYTWGSTRTLRILVGETTQNSLSNSSFVEESALTEVFSGSVTIPADDWVTITFATPFTYSGGNLVVTVLDNTGLWSSNYPAWAVCTSNGQVIYNYNDNYSYSVSNLSSASNYSHKPVLKLMVTPSEGYCPPVANLTVSNITTTSASIGWDEREDASTFYYQVKKASDSWVEEGDETALTNSVALTELEHSTLYDIRVKASCTSEQQSAYRTSSFYTLCANIDALPWTTNFETNQAGAMPNCWNRLNPYSDYPKIVTSSYYAYTDGSNVLEFRAGNTEAIAILPAFERSLNELQLSFYTRREGSSSGTLLIGYVTDVTDASTFVAIDSITSANIGDNDYHLYDFSFANVTIEGNITPQMAIAYHTREASSSYYWFVDNITVDEIPPCSRPAGITAVAGSDATTITWTSTGTDFEVYYKPVDSQEAYTLATNFTSTETNNTYTIALSNLTPATEYTYYIKVICEDTLASEIKTFKTECVALTSVPQIWDFETYDEDTQLPVCWTKFPSTTTDVKYSAYSSVSGANSLYIYGTNVVAILPTIDLTQLNLSDLQLRFKARQNYYDVTLQVGVMSDISDTSTFEVVSSFSLTTAFAEKIAMFSSYTGTGRYIALRLRSNSSVYLDDIVLENIPACPPVQQIQVTSISSNEATITWTGNNESYIVRYRTELDTVWSTANITTTGSSATISSLSPNTTYIVSIAPDCEETTDSTYRATYFTTLCLEVESPYTIDFEDESMVNCWTVASESEVYDYYYGSLSYPVLYQSSDATVAHSPSLFWGLAANGDDPVIVAAPKVNLDIELTRFQFYIRKNTNESYYAFDDIEVGVMTNPNDTSTFVPLHTINATDITSTYSLQTIDFNQFTEYTGNNYYVAIRYLGAYSMYYTGVYYIDDITITNIPSCVAPTGLVASNPTISSIDLSWTSDDNDFKVYYKPASAGDEVAYSSVNATLTEGVYTLAESDIESGTTYKYYVAAICSDNTESPSLISTFTTRCVSLDIPYTTGFEDVTVGARPLCWTFINNSGIYPAVSNSSYRGHNSSKGLEFRSTSNVSTAAIAVMPHFTENLNQLYVEFWAKPECNISLGAYGSGRLDVGYITDTTDASTFVLLDSISVYTLTDSAYYKYRVAFNDADLGDATTGWIAFRHVPNDNWFFYIDDVKVAEIPDCMEPTQLTSSNARANSIDLTWNTTATNATLSYKEDTATEYTNIENVSLDENGVYTLGNLQPNTTYNWKVSYVCASDNETYTSNVMVFTTACELISELPQTWDFETNNTFGDIFNPLPACWTRYSGGYPYVYESTNNAHGGTHYLYFYDASIGILPQVDTETLPMNTLQLNLWAKRTEFSNDFNLDIGVMTDPTNASTFTLVTSLPLTSTHQYFEVPFTSYTGEGTYIAIRNATVNSGVVDDVTLDLVPSCSRPTDVVVTATSDEVTLTWMSTGEEFEIYYKESSATEYDLAVATITSGATNNTYTATVSNLTPATTYDVYIKVVCSEGSQLESSVVTFTTSCVAINTVPQTWGFEATNNTAGTASYPLPSCWSRTGATQPYSYYNPGSAHQDSYVLYSYNNNALAVMPPIDTETLPISGLQLSFYGKNGGYSATTVEVGVMTDPADASTFTLVSSVELTSSYELYEIPFVSYTGTGSYIALRNVSSSSMYLDDVTLDQASDCTSPSAITVSATSNQATMTWVSSGTSFEIYYKTNAASTYDIADATITAGATEGTWTATINALNPSTLYDVYIKVICGEGENAQSNVVTFRTECTTIGAFPYTENFETLSTTDFGCWTTEIVSGTDNWLIRQFGNDNVAYRNYNNGSSYLISPVFDITSLNTPALSYNWETSRYNSSFDSLYVCYRTSPTSDWTVLVAHGPSRASDIVAVPSQDTVIALPNASTTYQIAFLASCHYGYGVSVDNVVISDNPSVVNPIEPTVVTNNTSNISQTSVTLNGTITDEGNQTITAKGFEWKTTYNGTYTQVLSTDDGNTFSYNLTNLTANTSYTYKAFVSTANGTVYGAEVVFTTLAEGDEPCTTVIASFSETICDGESFTFNGQTYTTTGMYTTLVAGQNGDCDTSYTITLTVLPQIAQTITETLCYGETFTFNGQTYNATGTYTTTVASQTEGCDTLYTINLTVLPQNEPINEEITISQSELPYEYHGQTYNDFGTYSVTTQDENGCDQVYNLTLVHNSGISEVEGGLTISLYPNPTDNNATLRVKGLNEQATIIITDQQGRVVSTKVLAEGVETMEIDSDKLASGVYYIRIQTTTTIRTEKLIKQA